MSATKLEELHSHNQPNFDKKLVLACPTYGPVDSRAAKTLRVAMMNASARGVKWLGDVSPDRMGWDAARNAAASAAVAATDAEGIVWVDSDMILPPDAVCRLLMADDHFSSGVYFQRIAPHYPLMGKLNGDSFSWVVEWPENVVFEADGIGFGCAYTSTAMLREMVAGLEEVKDGWFRRTKHSEDLSFCVSAAKLGFKPHVDTALLCGHLGDAEEVTVEHFRACNPYALGSAKAIQKQVRAKV